VPLKLMPERQTYLRGNQVCQFDGVAGAVGFSYINAEYII
jgi:hypothetical protein